MNYFFKIYLLTEYIFQTLKFMFMMAYTHWIGGTLTLTKIAIIFLKDAMNIYILTPLPLFCAITYACAGIF